MSPKPPSPKGVSATTAVDNSSGVDGNTDKKSTAMQLTGLPSRQNAGVAGDVMSLKTNHFPMNISKLGDIFVYTVEVKSSYKFKVIREKNGQLVQRKVNETPTPRRWPRILWLLLNQNAELASAATAYDKRLVSVTALTEHDGAQAWTVDLYENGEQQPGPGDPKRTFTVTLTYVKTLQADLFRSTGPTIEAGIKEEFLGALNLLLSRKPNQSSIIVAVGKTRLFDTATPINRWRGLGDGHGGLEAYFGFDRSVRSAAAGLLFQLNVSAAAFYPAVFLDQVINGWSKGSNRNAREAYQNSRHIELKQFIRGLRVQATYGTNRVYSVWGLATANYPTSARPTINTVKFDWVHVDSNGVITSTTRPTIREYLDQKYLNPGPGHTRDPRARPANVNALVINVGTPNHEVSISSEKLRVLEGNSYRRLLKPEQTGSMVRFAARGPLIIHHNPLPPLNDIVQNGLPMFGIAENVSRQPADGPMRNFQIEVTGKMLNVNGRRLHLPSLQCIGPNKGGNIVRYVGEGATDKFKLKTFTPRSPKADWLMTDLYFLDAPTAPKWTCIQFGDESGNFYHPKELQRFLKELVDFMREYCSSQQACAQFYELTQGSFFFSDPTTYTDAFKKMVENRYDIVFVVLPSKDAMNYETLKHLADCTVGIHTICVVRYPNWRPGLVEKAREVREIKQDGDYLTNLMLKCNLKLGGTNTALAYGQNDDEVRRLSSSTTMVVGADVTPGSWEHEGLP